MVNWWGPITHKQGIYLLKAVVPLEPLLRGYCFQLGNRVGSRRTMMTGSAWWACPEIPWSHTWGLILSSHSFWSLSIEGVMGFSVVTRSCRALGAEKLSHHKGGPQFSEYISSNKGVGHSGTTRNWWENICPSQQQRSAWVNLLVVSFLVAPKMVQVWEEKGLE